MDSHVATRLVAAKQLHSDGDFLRRRSDEAGRIQAAVMIDGAVELALKTVVAHRGLSTPSKQPNLPELITATSGVAPAAAPFEQHRKHRNSAQHSGIAPRSEVLDAMSRDARACLTEVFAACGASFERFTLTEFVVNAATREQLDAAEAKADTEPRIAIDHAASGVTWILSMGEALLADVYGIQKWHSYDPRSRRLVVTKNSDGRGELTHAMLKTMSASTLGFELPEFVKFASLAAAEPADAVDSSDAWWCIDYAARHAYRLERLMPQLETITIEEAGVTAPNAGILPLKFLRPRP